MIGSGPNPVSFSFYATKNLTTGEGGMLTGPRDLLSQARVISLHGMSRDAYRRYDVGGSWRYEVMLPGFKYNMSDIQAAIGLRQLAKLDRFQERRRAIVDAYVTAFSSLDALEVPIEQSHVEHAWHLFVLRLRLDALRIDRDRFIKELTERNIGTSVHFIPIHHHPYYRDKYGYRPGDFRVADHEFSRIVSLPLHPLLEDTEVNDVVDAVRDVVQTYSR
jgi:dTDP-4-amino-4,6-dideoxygalactose transaminase